jgi:hypothetical protein
MIGGSHKATNFPWLRSSESGGELGTSVGGYVIDAEASTALAIGSTVYGTGQSLDGSLIVSQPIGIQALKTLGLVVGGDAVSGGNNRGWIIQLNESTGLDNTPPDTYVGTIAAFTGQQVLICVLGVALAIIDTATIAGAALTNSAITVGQLTTVGAAAGNVVGILVDTTTTPNQVARVFVSPR